MPAVLLAGPPGSGKSTLAQALATHFSGHVLNKDTIREAIFGPSQVAYTVEQDDLVHDFMIAAAQSLWLSNPNLWIFFDGRAFSRAYQRNRVPAHHTILCSASDETIRRRLLQPHTARNRTWALYQKIRDNFEPITGPHLTINTDSPVSQYLPQAITYLTAAADT
jgi:predicted kinase